MPDKICIKCGACCKSLIIPVNIYTKDDAEFFQARGFKVKEKSTMFLNFPRRCPHLKDNNECDIYDTRPKACRDYPTGLMKDKRFLPKDCIFNEQLITAR